jgi:cyclophilin family peptidyl-prolyl cis-trans isomerase
MADPLPVIVLKTNLGEIQLELFEDDAPNTVANFVSLTESGFYDGTCFHRVIRDFMIQGGDPNSRQPASRELGRGGPGYRIADEFSSRRHEGKGILSMANSGPNTNGSQFFITHASTPHLDGKHTVFGRVTQGLDVVDTIATTKRDGSDKPLSPVTIVKATVATKREHGYSPRKL